jgi:hypothetical protein
MRKRRFARKCQKKKKKIKKKKITKCDRRKLTKNCTFVLS